MNLFLKTSIQKVFNALGYQLRKADNGVSYTDPYQEQKRILQNTPVNTIFEVGAADGRDCILYTTIFPYARVFAFEPLPDSFLKIEEKAKINKSIIPFNVAVSSQKGIANFYKTELEDASSLLQSQVTNSTFDVYQKIKGIIEVKTDTIDNICKDNDIDKIDLLKIDAQGAEMEILKGAINMLKDRKVRMIYLEVHFIQSYKNSPLYHEIAEFLVSNGFRLHNFFGLIHNQKGQISWGDALFLSKEIDF